MKKILSVLLAALLLTSLAASAFAEKGAMLDCSRSGVMIPNTAARFPSPPGAHFPDLGWSGMSDGLAGVSDPRR